MTTQHTPEPWYVAHHQFIYADGHLLVGQTACPPALSENPVATQKTNAERIVACVNACAGITDEQLTEILEDGGFAAIYHARTLDLVPLIVEKVAAEQQRDELQQKLAVSEAMYQSGAHYQAKCEELAADLIECKDNWHGLKYRHDELELKLAIAKEHIEEQAQRNLTYIAARDKLQERCDNYHDALYEVIDAARELISIVKIHSEATENNFAWAELQNLEQASAKAQGVV